MVCQSFTNNVFVLKSILLAHFPPQCIYHKGQYSYTPLHDRYIIRGPLWLQKKPGWGENLPPFRIPNDSWWPFYQPQPLPHPHPQPHLFNHPNQPHQAHSTPAWSSYQNPAFLAAMELQTNKPICDKTTKVTKMPSENSPLQLSEMSKGLGVPLMPWEVDILGPNYYGMFAVLPKSVLLVKFGDVSMVRSVPHLKKSCHKLITFFELHDQKKLHP